MTAAVAVMILSFSVAAAPVPQLAGLGAGCDAIFSDVDSGTGLAVEEALDNAASLVKSAGVPRQLAGLGAGCNAIFSDVDSGTGLAVEEALDNAASLVQSATKRQANKIGSGVGAVIDLIPGAEPVADAEVDLVNGIDGAGTSGLADLGTAVGDAILYTGETAGDLVPSSIDSGAVGTTGGAAGAGPGAGGPAGPPRRRQLAQLLSPLGAIPVEGGTIEGVAGDVDMVGGQVVGLGEAVAGQAIGVFTGAKAKRQANKIGAGVESVIDLIPVAGDYIGDIEGNEVNGIDGDGTGDLATVGQDVGADYLALGTQIGNAVPSSVQP